MSAKRATAMRIDTSRILLLAVAVALVGCVNSDLKPPPSEPYLPYTQQPLYRIDVGDVLDLRFPLTPELNEQAVVGPDGRISVQYAQNLIAAGRTLSEISADMKAAYAQQLTNPTLNVSIRSYAGTKVYVVGEVSTPGEFIANGPITVVQAITRAGGFKLLASERQVILVRHDADGKPAIYAVDVSGIANGYGPATADVPLSSYDIVYVPRSPIGDVSKVFEIIRGMIPFYFSPGYALP